MRGEQQAPGVATISRAEVRLLPGAFGDPFRAIDVLPGVRHYDFLPPCDARLSRKAPEVCKSLPGFDRAAFHEQFNADVVRFFQATLK